MSLIRMWRVLLELDKTIGTIKKPWGILSIKNGVFLEKEVFF
jgi:hypothetical protein